MKAPLYSDPKFVLNNGDKYGFPSYQRVKGHTEVAEILSEFRESGTGRSQREKCISCTIQCKKDIYAVSRDQQQGLDVQTGFKSVNEAEKCCKASRQKKLKKEMNREL